MMGQGVLLRPGLVTPGRDSGVCRARGSGLGVPLRLSWLR